MLPMPRPFGGDLVHAPPENPPLSVAGNWASVCAPAPLSPRESCGWSRGLGAAGEPRWRRVGTGLVRAAGTQESAPGARLPWGAHGGGLSRLGGT